VGQAGGKDSRSAQASNPAQGLKARTVCQATARSDIRVKLATLIWQELANDRGKLAAQDCRRQARICIEK
jgi:hypothetical protein